MQKPFFNKKLVITMVSLIITYHSSLTTYH